MTDDQHEHTDPDTQHQHQLKWDQHHITNKGVLQNRTQFWCSKTRHNNILTIHIKSIIHDTYITHIPTTMNNFRGNWLTTVRSGDLHAERWRLTGGDEQVNANFTAVGQAICVEVSFGAISTDVIDMCENDVIMTTQLLQDERRRSMKEIAVN